jgi:hypothetical protein
MQQLSILAATAIVAAAAGPSPVAVIDQTGGPPGHAHYVSLWQGSCDVGVITLSDRGRPIGRIARLNNALASLEASGMPDRTLTVRRYAVLLNGRAAEQGASGAATGLVGGLLAAGMMRKSCTLENTKEGWYPAQPTDPGVSPLVTEIEAEASGHTYSIRSVFFPDRELFPGMGHSMELNDPTAEPAVEAAMEKANAELIDDLRRDFPARPAG